MKESLMKEKKGKNDGKVRKEMRLFKKVKEKGKKDRKKHYS